MTLTIFIVELEHGKYYVGASKDPVKRLEELREGLGPEWTKVHKPVRMMERIPFKTMDDLNLYTTMAIRTYGLNNVRGGMWESVVLSAAELQSLRDECSNDETCTSC